MSPALRKSALLISLLPKTRRAQVLATQSSSLSKQLKPLIAQVESQGWNRRELVEAALGLQLDRLGQAGQIGLEEMIGLSSHIESTAFSRVLAAAALPDPQFLITLLEPDYGDRVRESLQQLPALPEGARSATLAWAIRVLEAPKAAP
jgi:hypothetical protein